MWALVPSLGILRYLFVRGKPEPRLRDISNFFYTAEQAGAANRAVAVPVLSV